MVISDLPVRHQVIFERRGEDGGVSNYKLEISIAPQTVKDAEAGDAIKQEDVIVAFEKRFRRRFPNDPLPSDILWGELNHPITPSV